MSIVSWEYYSSLHNKVTEQSFDSAEAKAEKEVMLVIGLIRWAEITSETFGYDVLKDCICNVIDRMVDDEVTVGRIGITSASNDGYTENYGNVATAESIQADLHKSIRMWLSGTGMVGAY